MREDLKVPRLPSPSMIRFVNISNFSCEQLFTLGHLTSCIGIFEIIICKGKIFLSMLMSSVVCVHFS